MERNTGGLAPPEHVLLTVLGTNPQRARYALEERQIDAQLAPIALYNLLPEVRRPDRVLALCTTEARKDSWLSLNEELGDRCQPVEIVAGDTQEDVNRFLATVTSNIPERVDLTVDVTHGFRHFSFLTYVAVLYLAALHGVRIRGAYYGMLNKHPKLSPFLDLRPLLDLPSWIHALEVLRDSGSTEPMARILRDGPDSQAARGSARDLAAVSEAYLSGLPLELGQQASNIRKYRLRSLRRLLGDSHRLPLADKLIERLDEILEPLALTSPPAGPGWKNQIRTSKTELQRQARIIDSLRDRGGFATALRLMREWVVSWVIWRTAPEDDWLNRSVRHDAETLLHAIKEIRNTEEHGVLTDAQRRVGGFWDALAEVRNAYAHHGMRGDDLVRDRSIKATRDRVVRVWEETLRECPCFDLSLSDSFQGRILVSPIGMRPGVLFSALQACRTCGDREDPALCLIICSPETQGRIAEALRYAKYVGKMEPVLLEDAFGGGSETISRLAHSTRRHFIGATEVLVNITGGTTMMGLAAEKLAAAARSLACPVRRFGLIDRRPPEHQEVDPYQAGEPFWLDAGNEDAN